MYKLPSIRTKHNQTSSIPLSLQLEDALTKRVSEASILNLLDRGAFPDRDCIELAVKYYSGPMLEEILDVRREWVIRMNS